MNKSSNDPLYIQLADEMKSKINDGSWPKGEKIPSERDLIQLYDVSRMTVRSAIMELSNVGILEKVHGKGTFVKSKTIVQDLGGLYSFSEEMKKQGLVGTTQVIGKLKIHADSYLADKLNIPEGSEILELQRLRFDDVGNPLLYERSYFPFEKYSFLIDEELQDHSLYELLEVKYNITFDDAIEKFKATKLNNEELQIFGLNNDDNNFGLLIRRTSYKNNKIEYYSSLVTLGDVFEFSMKLQNS